MGKINLKTKILIKSRFTYKVLFEFETKDNTIKKTVEEAIKKGANLRRADLRRANLRGADLWGANLWGAKNLKFYWHIHHKILVENLTEPLKNRIKYIKENKIKEEIKLRLKLLKKVKAKKLPTTKEGWEKLHKKECPNCSWNGNTIFPTNT